MVGDWVMETVEHLDGMSWPQCLCIGCIRRHGAMLCDWFGEEEVKAATELGEVIMRKDEEIAKLRAKLAIVNNLLTAAIDDKAAEPSAGVVAERVDAVIRDVLAQRTTPQQNKALRNVAERAERISPKADAAVGKAVGG